MSVIMRNLAGNSGGGSSKGFPPGDATNITIVTGSGYVSLKWTDPDNTIEGTTTLSTWYSTIIVRKEGSAPTSIKDGVIVLKNTTRNKYKDNYYTDSNVEINKTYYYRFYTMSTDKVYNDSTNMIYSITVKEYDTVLKNNSWIQIAAASEEGIASTLWNIGDEIDLTLSGIYNETITLQIWDFNHFYRSDSMGTAGICFGMKNLMKNVQYMNESDTNSGGWNNTYMKNYVMSDILKSMPYELRTVIKEVNTFANQGSNCTEGSYGYLSKDKVFIPGFAEIFSTSQNPYQSKTEQNQKKLSIFTDDNSRIKKMDNGNGDAQWWWTRSPLFDTDDSFCVAYKSVSDNKGGATGMVATNCPGVCFCFNV